MRTHCALCLASFQEEEEEEEKESTQSNTPNVYLYSSSSIFFSYSFFLFSNWPFTWDVNLITRQPLLSLALREKITSKAKQSKAKERFPGSLSRPTTTTAAADALQQHDPSFTFLSSIAY